MQTRRVDLSNRLMEEPNAFLQHYMFPVNTVHPKIFIKNLVMLFIRKFMILQKVEDTNTKYTLTSTLNYTYLHLQKIFIHYTETLFDFDWVRIACRLRPGDGVG